MVVVADSGTGNLRSLVNALRSLGFPTDVAERPPRLPHCVRRGQAGERPEALILPGVGAFGHAAEELRRRGWYPYLREASAMGTRLVGICLGMQLLFESSEESPGAEGLGLLKGRVRRIQSPKVPHIAWARLRFVREPQGFEWAYFVHSYVAAPEDPSVIAAYATYGEEFPAVVRQRNIVGVQFHPEKSQGPGLAFLRSLLSPVSSEARS